MALFNRRRRWRILPVAAILFLFLLHYLKSTAMRDMLDMKELLKEDLRDGRFHWSSYKHQYPVQSMTPLPPRTKSNLRRIQHDFSADTVESIESTILRKSRQKAIKDSFIRCWTAYKELAWMGDELAPISGKWRTTFGGWAATLIDSLDTLWIMDMKDDFLEAVRAVDAMDFGNYNGEKLSVFETTIRHLGGLLSAYDLSGERILLKKAIELGNMLYAAFDTPNRMPVTRWSPELAKQGKPQVPSEWCIVAEVGSLSMEFTRLSQVTGDPKWYDAVDRISRAFDTQQNATNLPGMWPLAVDAQHQDFTHGNEFTLNGMADSLYEYFPKMYALLGGQSEMYHKLYLNSMDTAIKHVLYRPMLPDNADVLISGEVSVYDRENPHPINPKGQHLGCFTGGMFALGSRLFDIPSHMDVAHKLVDGCIWAYKSVPSGIMPEIFFMVACNGTSDETCSWDEDIYRSKIVARYRYAFTSASVDVEEFMVKQRLPRGYLSIHDAKYVLRPEAIESVFVLYRLTGRKDLLDSAWDMFQAIEKGTHTELANAAVTDVTKLPAVGELFASSSSSSDPDDRPLDDSMESFWLAETLKYFYLIFSEPKLINLDEWVLNTEAHPFRIK